MKINFSNLKIIIFAVIFGLGAGVVGQIISATYLLPPEIFTINEEGRAKQIVSQTAENKKILEAAQNTLPTILEIFPKKIYFHNPENQIYLPDERIALGTALTSDGWLVSFGQELINAKNNFVVITNNQKIFEPKKIIVDEATKTIFIKIDADNLSVPKLGSKENISLGEKILIPKNKQSFKIIQIADSSYRPTADPKDLFISSEKFSKFILLDQDINQNEIGTPLVNLSGEIIGIISNTSPATAVPINFWRDAFLEILKTEKTGRPYLGIHYLDLGNSPGIDDAWSQGRTAGALILSDKNSKISGVAKNSPAEVAGLRDGDIIIKIDNENLSQKIDLAEIVSQHSPADKIQITILRNGEEKTIEVTLSEKL
ncbi:MAG: PDZ domain-containing protein [Patescibacteria group bacterium]